MEHGVSLSSLQEPATVPCPEPDQSSSHLTFYFLKSHFNISLCCRLRVNPRSGLFVQALQPNVLYHSPLTLHSPKRS
jgi:hypothetical protein